MLGLNTLSRAVRQLAGSLARLSATLEEANSGLRQRLALDQESAGLNRPLRASPQAIEPRAHQPPEPVASLPGPSTAEPVQPVAPSKRNGRTRSV